MSRVTNIVRYLPSGAYFARVRVGGKLIRKSLRTKQEYIAKPRLADLMKEERQRLQKGRSPEDERMTFGQAKELYLDRLANDPKIKPRTREYRQYCLQVVVKSWPGLDETEVRKITEDQCRDWAAKFYRQYAAAVYNNTARTLRLVLEMAIEKRGVFQQSGQGDPTDKGPPKRGRSPGAEGLPGHRPGNPDGIWSVQSDCADLVEFLTFTGCRKSEAAQVTWRDVDFDKGELVIRGDPEHGTKNGEIRRVPMVSDARRLLTRMRQERPAETADSHVVRVRECQKSLDRACRKVGCARLTHHDLRHLFATRCIESGVDIPTVAKWLGHKHGGALAMRIYGHLRDQHSASMAQKVTFSK